jgi:hypothetical protein
MAGQKRGTGQLCSTITQNAAKTKEKLEINLEQVKGLHPNRERIK